jgi:hypothetical protein
MAEIAALNKTARLAKNTARNSRSKTVMFSS